MNKCIVNITADLGLKTDREALSDAATIVDGIREKIHCHQNILKI